MDAPAILARLRDRKTLSKEELGWFAHGLANAQVTDAQAGAFAMAVFLNGLSASERADLTLAMRDSGKVLDWHLDGPAIDKHSTGGIGDCVSLLLAPALAACGAYVPMISGRGLGHTGGTLDKLESIPGFKTDFAEPEFRAIVADAGAAIVAASAEIAPADRRLYAIRDVTGTVESIDLITASILSKKLAGGLSTLVLDIKMGSGAFMKSLGDAEALARALVRTANDAGCATTALITNMDQPCAPAIGNALEVVEVMRVLRGDTTTGILSELTKALGGEVLAQAGLAASATAGEAMIEMVIADGSASERFAKMVRLQGGPADFIEDWPSYLRPAPVTLAATARHGGYVNSMDGQALGNLVVRLGGGRLRQDDVIDHGVGLSDILPLGSAVDIGQSIAIVHARTDDEGEAAVRAIGSAISVGAEPAAQPLVHKRVG